MPLTGEEYVPYFSMIWSSKGPWLGVNRAGRRSYGENSGRQFSDRGLGSRRAGPIRNHFSFPRFNCESGSMASRYPAPAGHVADPLQQSACDGENPDAGRGKDPAADHHRWQCPCRPRCGARRSSRMACVAGLVQILLAPRNGKVCRADPALWKRRSVQLGRASAFLHEL